MCLYVRSKQNTGSELLFAWGNHLLDNLLHDVTGSMSNYMTWRDSGLKPIARLLSSRRWRERFHSQCTHGTPDHDDDSTQELDINAYDEHVQEQSTLSMTSPILETAPAHVLHERWKCRGQRTLQLPGRGLTEDYAWRFNLCEFNNLATY